MSLESSEKGFQVEGELRLKSVKGWEQIGGKHFFFFFNGARHLE